MNPTMRACGAAAALVLLILPGISSAAGGTYYRWIDESGTPVNSDRPPPAGIEYETITTNTNLRVEDSATEESVSTGSKPVQDDASAQVDTLGQRMVVVKNPEACTIARQNLETLNTHARIRMPDGEGSFRYLGEEEKAAERAKAEAAIKQNCE